MVSNGMFGNTYHHDSHSYIYIQQKLKEEAEEESVTGYKP